MKFLINTRTDWNEPPRARHQLTEALADDNEVVFVSSNQFGFPKIKELVINTNLKILTINWFLNGKIRFRIPFINELYQLWLFRKIKKNYKIDIVINFDHTASLIHKFFKNTIYYCNDDFHTNDIAKLFIIKQYFKITEKIVAKNSKICFSVCDFLNNKLLNYNPNSYISLTAITNKDIQLVDLKFNKNNKPVIVYVGWLNKIEESWIANITLKGNYIIYLIGPGSNDFEEKICKYIPKDKILNISNKSENKDLDDTEGKILILTGSKKGIELSHYLNKADVFIAPYKMDNLTEEVYAMPNKFWLYLAYGKPIVSCNIKSLNELPEKFVYFSSNEYEFLNNIDKSLLEDNEELRLRRNNYAKQNTWKHRVDEMFDYLKKHDLLNKTI